MSDLLGKISSYNLFNYLLSGILFVILVDVFTSYSFVQKDLVVGVFLYYFIGLVISRIGSLFVEPVLKWIKFLRFADYADFVRVSKVDSKLEILSEQNNIYRTLIAVFGSVIFLKAFELLKGDFASIAKLESELLFIFILLLLLFGYRKQTAYITKRIDSNPKSHE